MRSRLTNLGLLAVLVVAGLTGALAFGSGTAPGGTLVVTLHGLAGLALIVLTPWKSTIVRRGWSREHDRRWIGAVLGGVAVVTVGTGVLHSAGLRWLGPVTTMQVHVGAAMALLPLMVAHVVARPVAPRRADLGRRTLLRAGGVLGAGGLLVLAVEGLFALAGARGARRRFTGSHEVGSFEPAAMPVTQWLFDAVPRVDAGTWRLTVSDAGGTRTLGLPDLAVPLREMVATIDCTGGWYAEQRWAGVPLRDVVRPAPDTRSVVAVSVTGYARRFPVADLDHLLVATRVGGGPLAPGHGFPARLVVPGRRGFWWVKWLDRIETSPQSWWSQPPFPLQ